MSAKPSDLRRPKPTPDGEGGKKTHSCLQKFIAPRAPEEIHREGTKDPSKECLVKNTVNSGRLASSRGVTIFRANFSKSPLLIRRISKKIHACIRIDTPGRFCHVIQPEPPLIYLTYFLLPYSYLAGTIFARVWKIPQRLDRDSGRVVREISTLVVIHMMFLNRKVPIETASVVKGAGEEQARQKRRGTVRMKDARCIAIQRYLVFRGVFL